MSLANKLAPIILKFLPDKYYSIIQYYYWQKRLPNLSTPRTFNEKIQWTKLNVRNPLLPICVDKYLVRDHVRSVVSEDILIPMLGIYEKPEEIDYDSLPDRFALKATHGSGWNILCRSKADFDRESAWQTLDKWRKLNFYNVGREWAYKDVVPRILCEEFISSPCGESPPDYKIFCFHGEPKFIQVDFDRFSAHKRNLYDCDWNLLPVSLEYPNDKAIHEAPEALSSMLDIAHKLSSSFPFVRVDLYAIGEKIYFGELTFYPGKGTERFFPRQYDEIFGGYLNIQPKR